MKAAAILNRLLRIDRRFIYTLVFAAVTLPFFVDWPPIRIDVSRETADAFEMVEAIQPGGDPLLLSFDYDPASEAELTPMAEAILRHCFSRGIRVCVISLQYTGQGAGIASEVVPRIAAEYGKVMYEDWAFLGFQPNPVVAMLGMGEDIGRVFPADYFGKPLSEIPMMNGIQNYDRIPAVFTLASTAVGESWAIFAGSRYGLKVLGGLTAVYVADVQPFYRSGQISGVLGGLKGAAEYEKLLGQPGDGMAGMRSQKMVHYLIILFIVLGNAAYILGRRRRS